MSAPVHASKILPLHDILPAPASSRIWMTRFEIGKASGAVLWRNAYAASHFFFGALFRILLISVKIKVADNAQ